MRRIIRHRPSPAMAVAFIALVVALGGVAVASIPGPGGTVKGCYSKSTGALRVIDSKKSCSSKRERTLSWNQQGPRGLRGLQGDQGPQGFQGVKGDTGPSTGPAGGALRGSYPDPALADGAVGTSKFAALPAASVSSTAHPIANDSTSHTLGVDSTAFDTAGLHGDMANPSRLTAPVAGLYQASATVFWDSNTTGRRFMGITKNGGSANQAEARVSAAVNGGTALSASALVRLQAGDYLEVKAEIAGATAPVNATLEAFSINWVAPA